MDDFLGIIIGTAFLGLSCIGVSHLAADYRHFDTLKEQCERQGYIQNQTVRITCAVEKKQ